jgi:hypothetical protein
MKRITRAQSFGRNIMNLVDTKTGNKLKAGDTVTTFRGEKMTLVSFRAPHKVSSSGRVCLKDDKGRQHEYFPGVIKAKIVTDADQNSNTII